MSFQLLSIGGRVHYLAWIRESTLSVTCVYIRTTVDQEGIRSCRLAHVPGVAYILICRNQLQSSSSPLKFEPAQRSVCYSSSCWPWQILVVWGLQTSSVWRTEAILHTRGTGADSRGGLMDDARLKRVGQSVEAGTIEEWRMIAVVPFPQSGCCDTYTT